MLAPLRPVGVELLGQPPPDLVENEADERLGAADVRWRDDEVERGGMIGFDEIGNAPVAARRDRRHGRVTIEAKKAHRRGENAAALVRSEEHTSELQSLMRISYAVFCLKKKKKNRQS